MKSIFLGLFAMSMVLFSGDLLAQCDPNHVNSHELENASNATISYTAYLASSSNLCGTTTTVSGTVNDCSSVCIVPASGLWVVGIQVTSGSNTFFDGYPNCYSPSGSPKDKDNCEGETMSFHLEWVGMNQSVFEP